MWRYVKNCGFWDFRLSRSNSAGDDVFALVAKGRHIGLGALSPRQNTSKIAFLAAELLINPRFSTTFSTVVEILGEKPKASCHGTRNPVERDWGM